MMPYRPEPFTDFNNESEENRFKQALVQVRTQLGRDYPLFIGNKTVETKRRILSVNPSNFNQVIGSVSHADAVLAEQAIQTAYSAFATWSGVSLESRADCLFRAAAELRRRKHEFSAWLMVEAGKVRTEADGETAEAIDFMEYYGRQMLQLAQRGERELIGMSGERNRLDYLGLGVGIIIAPWNFPLAILAGMTTAALVAGNTVVVKPSSLTPVIAIKFVELLRHAGIPTEAVQLLPGSGKEIGQYLTAHPLTRFISFTGSKDVGLHLHELSSRQVSGQRWLKRFVGELGGKDAIIVDRDADLEQAAQGIVASAFGYSGQKCSACSRAIVHRDVYDAVLKRCSELADELKVGDVQDFYCGTGPVINQSAYESILGYIHIAKTEGRITAGGSAAGGDGWFIRPTVVADADPGSRIMQEEIFGPLLAFTKADDFEDALRIANFSDYGLTGSVYTHNRKNIERARDTFAVGNLYINRKCTGAIVGVHPFGGFNLSGTDSKAGGPDYLQLFTQPKLTSERL
ncbi:L-glutamate gamma-semialdehyde dehydrogenase [Paenibacillus sp. LMG 31456]|uniref:L-glutamate gamma-semialdehyde dehydrogenase n=1 Tax=Paenibacillus foliorum TaxID=2654974 RepID=A0A972GPI5_9BACL|nr:L-glutamate gamma-semialdehyde dehydrogenase [Paenibacillus foliorum]NOU94489.1 L-glutamate gamma-semialdehyde dehydrogenase [Paenibacillus foliorum]